MTSLLVSQTRRSAPEDTAAVVLDEPRYSFMFGAPWLLRGPRPAQWQLRLSVNTPNAGHWVRVQHWVQQGLTLIGWSVIQMQLDVGERSRIQPFSDNHLFFFSGKIDSALSSPGTVCHSAPLNLLPLSFLFCIFWKSHFIKWSSCVFHSNYPDGSLQQPRRHGLIPGHLAFLSVSLSILSSFYHSPLLSMNPIYPSPHSLPALFYRNTHTHTHGVHCHTHACKCVTYMQTNNSYLPISTLPSLSLSSPTLSHAIQF